MLELLLQAVVAFAPPPHPVRFGFPVPARALTDGLRLNGRGALQWRPLPFPPREGVQWVELAIVPSGGGEIRVVLGGDGPTPSGTGAVVALAGGAEHDGALVQRWEWVDGTVDERRRRQLAAPEWIEGERYGAGEAITTESTGMRQRWHAVTRLPHAALVRAGLLPPDLGLADALRVHLTGAAHAMRELPGRRGAGDYARSDGVVTNLEFDTPLALLRLGLWSGDPELLDRARRAAWHLVDRDLDTATGLPFAHGPDHRTTPPQPGHAWSTGLLWIGLLTADRELVDGARQIVQALAARRPAGDGRDERARDFAWPLAELEAWLQVDDDPGIAVAADAMAAAIGDRFDADTRTFRFGEGEAGAGTYFERGWITGGVVLPALRAHLARREDPRLLRKVEAATSALVTILGRGGGGLPTHWRTTGGHPFAEHRATGCPKALLMLEGLPLTELRRLLQRPGVFRAVAATPAFDDPDLATSLTMVARCSWIYR